MVMMSWIPRWPTRGLFAPQALVAQGIREVTNVVLFPVRFLATLASARPLTNCEAVETFALREVGPVRELVIAALAWREAGLLPAADLTTPLLGDGRPPLYRELVSRYEARMRELDELILAGQLAKWGERLREGARRAGLLW